MPTPPHIEKHFTAGETVRDIVIGMSDGLTVSPASPRIGSMILLSCFIMLSSFVMSFETHILGSAKI